MRAFRLARATFSRARYIFDARATFFIVIRNNGILLLATGIFFGILLPGPKKSKAPSLGQKYLNWNLYQTLNRTSPNHNLTSQKLLQITKIKAEINQIKENTS